MSTDLIKKKMAEVISPLRNRTKKKDREQGKCHVSCKWDEELSTPFLGIAKPTFIVTLRWLKWKCSCSPSLLFDRLPYPLKA